MVPFGLDGANLNDAKSYVVSDAGPGPVKKKRVVLDLKLT